MAFILPLPGSAGAQGGTGETAFSRLPWEDGDGVILTQGWFGCNPSHCIGNGLQYATDWNGSFPVVMATEGAATCQFLSGGGWGNTILVARSDGLVDRYAHLDSCPFVNQHVEQGDFVGANSLNTGCFQSNGKPCGFHLHFQVENTAGQSQSFPLSGIAEIPESTVGNTYTSDNAGPGVNDAGNLIALNNIYTVHANLGHFFCVAARDRLWRGAVHLLRRQPLGERPALLRGRLGVIYGHLAVALQLLAELGGPRPAGLID